MPPRRSPGTCPGSCLVPQPVAGCGRTPAGAHPSADQGAVPPRCGWAWAGEGLAPRCRPPCCRCRGAVWTNASEPLRAVLSLGCHSAKSTRPERLTGRIERPPGLAGPRAVSCGLRGPHYPLRRSRGTRPGFCPVPQPVAGSGRMPAGAQCRPGPAVPPSRGGRVGAVGKWWTRRGSFPSRFPGFACQRTAGEPPTKLAR
jgi:hypothetical protein